MASNCGTGTVVPLYLLAADQRGKEAGNDDLPAKANNADEGFGTVRRERRASSPFPNAAWSGSPGS